MRRLLQWPSLISINVSYTQLVHNFISNFFSFFYLFSFPFVSTQSNHLYLLLLHLELSSRPFGNESQCVSEYWMINPSNLSWLFICHLSPLMSLLFPGNCLSLKRNYIDLQGCVPHSLQIIQHLFGTISPLDFFIFLFFIFLFFGCKERLVMCYCCSGYRMPYPQNMVDTLCLGSQSSRNTLNLQVAVEKLICFCTITLLQEDDEHTIEEDEAFITEEERKEELAALQDEMDLPMEELLKRYANDEGEFSYIMGAFFLISQLFCLLLICAIIILLIVIM